MIETINLSGSFKIKSSSHSDMLSKYRRVAPHNPSLSLHDFVMKELATKEEKIGDGTVIIPHYLGANGQPKFPPTKEYAMATLIVYKPWADSKPPHLSDQEWIEQFENFIVSPQCPLFAKMEYARVKDRVTKKRNAESVATEECYDNEEHPEMDDETRDIINIVTHLTKPTDSFFSVDDIQFDKGLAYDWGTRIHPVSDALNS